ncbi:hypothetical protein ACFVWX_27885 [Streptomyces sp. NPDC058220]|uniref:hypothetical protein n=1 Tax=Streptomyces sp. NPDC058220 TaxID=3346387 RepID=UPI0036E1F0DA
MICPHCERNLLLKERPGRVCSKCGRRYALDPKTNSLRLSDARIKRLVEKLTDGGQLTISVNQLWAAAARTTQKAGKSIAGGIGCAVLGVPVAVALIAAGVSIGGAAVVLVVLGALLLVFVVGAVVSTVSDRRALNESTLSTFRTSLLTDWKQIYGSLPPGVIEHYTAPAVQQPEGAHVALLCHDKSIAAFLIANEIPQRYGVAVATEIQQLPDAVPVIVLHDASPAGCQLPLRTRAALPGRRVVDAGLPPRAVMNAKGAVAVRRPKPAPDLIGRLRDSGTLTEAELAWLAKGWTVLLIAVPPVRLIAAVVRAVERVGATTDPDRRRAEAVGFLTWPGESGR